ncbi:MAG TPA: non-homologous end-joining DNA ligase [Candidatus Saccharimonadales bacterium]|nr:non-homologous end-joining DNA ligase [Candidatus Saccharimonadales bacterium]
MNFTNVTKIWFPKSKISKQNIIDYYDKISNYFIAQAQNHLMVLQRFPDGIKQVSFYQKNISDYFPDFIDRKTILLKLGQRQTLVVINNAQSLLYLVNQGTIVFHSWLSTTQNQNKPDKIIFDLDPSTSDLKPLRIGAKLLKKMLEDRGLVPFLMTTGSHGYHITVPIKPEHSFAKIRTFAKQMAQDLVNTHPDLFTITLTKSKRGKKVFVDYLRNSFGATAVAPYSVRAIEKAPVATPIHWDELSKTTPQKYNIKNIFKRLATKGDAWKDFHKKRKHLEL